MVIVDGAGFEPGVTVSLVASDGVTYSNALVEVQSATRLTASYAAGAVPPGLYSVQVAKPGGDADTLLNALEIVSGGMPKLETRLIVPGTVGRHALATLYVEYANTGDAPMPAPLLVVHGTERPFLTLQQQLLTQGFWTSARPEGFSETVQLLASGTSPGLLQPGESFQVPVYFAGLQQPWSWNANVEFTLGVLTADNSDPADWSSLKGGMKPASISAEAWDSIWASFVRQVGTTWGDYVKMLDDNAAYRGPPWAARGRHRRPAGF
jgi:hypothetical protein